MLGSLISSASNACCHFKTRRQGDERTRAWLLDVCNKPDALHLANMLQTLDLRSNGHA